MNHSTVRQTVLILTIAIFLAGCGPIDRFSSAVDDARQADRPIVVYRIDARTGTNDYSGPVGVYFINTASEPLKSVTFSLLPYRHYRAVRRAIKGFTAKGPFASGHAY